MKQPPLTYHGIDLRKALRTASELGCRVQQKLGTDDVLVWHPRFTRPLLVSTGRKDCPRSLSLWLNRLSNPPAP